MISFHLISKSFQKPHFNFENNLILFNVGIKHIFPLEATLSLVSSVLIAFLNITKFIHPLVQALNYNENIHFRVKKQTPNDIPRYIHAISLEGIPNT